MFHAVLGVLLANGAAGTTRGRARLKLRAHQASINFRLT